jgi:hypothetical protein
MKRIASLVTALLAVVLLAAPVGAAPSSATITLDQSDVSAGDTITFTTTGDGDWINLNCYAQGHRLVQSSGQPTGYSFTLRFSGEADCRADLLVQGEPEDFLFWKRLASVKFHVSA